MSEQKGHKIIPSGGGIFNNLAQRIKLIFRLLGDWLHLKDGWICLRSNGTVRLTVIVDGTYTDTYELQTTSGEKSRIYVEFRPRKGRLYQIKLDGLSATPGAAKAPFRLYGEDSLLYGKLWKTDGSYDTMQPFGAIGYAQYLRKEGGT